MENPQCVLLNFVKVEDGDFEVKQEGADTEDVETDVCEDDDPLAGDEDVTDHGDTLYASNYVETIHSKQPSGSVGSGGGGSGAPAVGSQQQQQQRRRLRFSDADDRLLLAEVVKHDPYRQAAHWRDITATVAQHANKAFTARSVREHTDHLMNSYALKGEDTCLRRTPVEFWDQKKRLLHQVYQMWKDTGRSSLASAGGKDHELEDEDETVVDASTLAAKTRAAKASQAHKQNSQTAPRSVFLQQPLTLHLNGSQLRVACPPLQPLSSVVTTSTVSALSGIQLQGLQRATVTGGLSPSLISKSLLLQTPSVPSKVSATTAVVAAMTKAKASEQVAETTEQASKSTEESATTAGAVIAHTTDRACSPILIKVEKQGSLPKKFQELEGNSSQGERASAATQTENRSARRLRRERLTNLMRARLQWEINNRRQRVALRHRALRLDERQLALDERRLQLEERRWAQELSERQLNMSLLKEERSHRMAMELRQQGIAEALSQALNRKN